MGATIKGPVHYIHPDPQPRTPCFGGEFIDMRRLADERDYDYTYLSKIFSGSKLPGPEFAQRLAKDLGLTLPELYTHCMAAKATRLRA